MTSPNPAGETRPNGLARDLVRQIEEALTRLKAANPDTSPRLTLDELDARIDARIARALERFPIPPVDDLVQEFVQLRITAPQKHES